MNKKLLKFDITNLFLPIVFILSWIFLPVILGTPEYLVPSFKNTVLGLYDFITGSLHLSTYSGKFLENSISSWYRVIVGFSIATFFGVVFALVSGYFIYARKILDPFINMIRMIPGIGWFPLAMVWFGVGNKTTIFLIALAAFFPIYLNTLRAVIDIPENIINSAKILGAKKSTLFRTIIIPASIPGMFSGLRLGMGICWAYLVLGELTGVNEGLGAVMMDSRMLGNVDMIIVCMIAIAFWGRLADLILIGIYKKIRPREIGGKNE